MSFYEDSLGDDWDESLAQDYIEKNHLYYQDIPFLQIDALSSPDKYSISFANSLHFQNLYPGPDPQLYTWIDGRKKAEDILDAFSQLLRERKHPYENDMDSYLKPSSQRELEAFIMSYGKSDGDGIIGGPDNRLDCAGFGNVARIDTPEGAYLYHSWSPTKNVSFRSLQHQVLFVPRDTGPFNLSKHNCFIGEDAFAYALDDISLGRFFSTTMEHALGTGMELAFFRYDEIKDATTNILAIKKKNSPWEPGVREPMPELAGPSGYIPYTGYVTKPVDEFLADSIISHFQILGMEITDKQKSLLFFQGGDGLLDPYEIGAIIESQNIDHLDSMLARNTEFYTLKRERNKEIDLHDPMRHLSPSCISQVEELHRNGFISESDIIRISGYTSPAPNKEQIANSYIQEIHKKADFYQSLEMSRSR